MYVNLKLVSSFTVLLAVVTVSRELLKTCNPLVQDCSLLCGSELSAPCSLGGSSWIIEMS